MKQLRIKDIKGIRVISGQIMSRVTASTKNGEESIGTYKVIIPKCINSDGTLTLADMAEEELKTVPDEKRVTKAGDIVMKLSTPYSAAMIDKSSEGCLVPSFCAIVKCSDPDIDPDYLLAFINSELCKDQLKRQVAGAVMTVLSVGKVSDVLIPVPSIEKQKQVAAEYMESQRKLMVIREIMALTEKRNDVVFKDLVKEDE